ncbi:helix-turn-helix transcriptional regulator [Planotetraspora phitsanulokensis]|uniref:Transcriptional regulator n=2 Tax=Planotetraspora phitsanulokensis TaxID=575192 RepID=A0A8J3XCV6_9ACTN|nr:transcriptional regulator [Planotetraspora phitsanulokensis]
MLAGLSTDYYTRLEQGRERNPSPQVLAALADAFGFDLDATEHLYELVRPRPHRQSGASADQADDEVNRRVLRFVEKWDDASVIVVNHRLDIVATNRAASVLLEGFERVDNLIRMTFLSPAAREFWLDWGQEAAANVAHLRAVAGAGHDPRVVEIVDELSRESEDFRSLWARYDVRIRKDEFVRVHRREVGEMIFWNETIRTGSAPGLHIFVGEPASDGPTGDTLAKLRTLIAGN